MPKEGDKIAVKEIDYESWAQGYRAAVWDLTPVPANPADNRQSGGSIIFAYLIGLFLGYVVFKYSA